jgi:uncharacterized protein
MSPIAMPVITLLIAAALALITVWLGVRVMLLRYGRKVSLGHGQDALLEARVRAHGNLTEYAPIALILMGLIEMRGGSPTALWLLGAALVVGRLLHPFGLERRPPNALRILGMLATWGVILGLAGWAIAIGFAPQPTITYLN